MIIDMHVHLSDKRIYPGYWLDGIRQGIQESIRRINGAPADEALLDSLLNQSMNDYDCSRLVARMEDAGIGRAAVLLVDFGYGRDDAPLELEELYAIHAEALRKYPEQLCVFAGVDPRRGREGLALLEKGITEYGFCGLKLYPPCGFEQDDKLLYPFYELCDHYGLPVLSHTGSSLPSMKTDFQYPQSVLQASRDFPHIPFILGHAALVHYEESVKLPLMRDNIYLETSGFQSMLSEQEELLLERVKGLFKTCEDRVLFGTDWPLFSGMKQAVDYFRNLDCLTDQQKDKLFYQNAEAVFAKRMNSRQGGITV